MLGLDRRDIERRLDAWIEWKFSKHSNSREMTKFLIMHERKHVCVDNLLKELTKLSIKRPNTSIEQLAQIIDATARMFCSAAIDSKHQSMISDAEKQRLRKESSKINDYEAEQKELRKEFKIDDTANDKSL